MHLHPSFERFRSLRLPVLAAPMFLVSGPELVVAATRSGVIGTFPAPNCRTTDELSEWLAQISGELRGTDGGADPCWGVNLVVHRTNARLAADLEVVVRHQVPLVIASVGSAAPVVAPVHGYGGLVFTDVVSLKHARQAIAAGVDGLILLTTGAGGHEGTANPIAFVREIRRIFDGPIVLAGCVSDGESILAARALGADGVAVGTAFIAATESMASDAYRAMLLEASMDDILCSSALSGMNANLLRDSFTRAGFDASRYARRQGDVNVGELIDHDLQKQRWKDIWAAGQGAGGVRHVQPVAAIVEQFEREYRAAFAELARGVGAPGDISTTSH